MTYSRNKLPTIKLSSALTLAVSVDIVSAKCSAGKGANVSASQKAGGAGRKLMRAACRSEDEEQQNDNQAEEEECACRHKYRVQFVRCISDYQFATVDGREVEGSA